MKSNVGFDHCPSQLFVRDNGLKLRLVDLNLPLALKGYCRPRDACARNPPGGFACIQGGRKHHREFHRAIASVRILPWLYLMNGGANTDIPIAVTDWKCTIGTKVVEWFRGKGIPMQRREWLTRLSLFTMAGLTGCRGYQYGHVIKPDAANLVGSHEAGAEVFDPLVDEAVAKLLARQNVSVEECQLGPDGLPCKKTICFVCIENKCAEDIGDFKDQLYNQIDSKILESHAFQPISRRMIDAGLYETRMRPDALMLPDNMRLFTAVLQRNGAPVDYFLYAILTSGTTKRNSSTQRDYDLTLELTNLHSGQYDKVTSEVRKGYHKTAMGKIWNYNPLKR